jgi:hypothetical protein
MGQIGICSPVESGGICQTPPDSTRSMLSIGFERGSKGEEIESGRGKRRRECRG